MDGHQCPDCDWKEQRLHLNESLKRLESRFDRFEEKQESRDGEIYKRLTSLQVAEGMLRVKSGAWGLIGSLVVAVGLFFWEFLKGK